MLKSHKVEKVHKIVLTVEIVARIIIAIGDIPHKANIPQRAEPVKVERRK